jgi:hypothetical protein
MIIMGLLLLIVLACSFGTVAPWESTSVTFYGNHEYNGDKDKITDGTCSCHKAYKYGICYNNC